MMWIENRYFRLVHALREAVTVAGNETFPLENADETIWMFTNIEGFILPKFATADDIERIIRKVQIFIIDECISDDTVQDAITDCTERSWC